MLSNRLQTIIDMVPSGAIVADVGTDHGLLACALINQAKATKVYAIDNKIGPLKQASKNIEACGLHDSITCIQADGLTNLPSDVDTVIMAGLGYETVLKILTDNFDKLADLKLLIVQINKQVPQLRQWLKEKHFTIVNEALVHEKHYYEIVGFNTKKGPEYSLSDIYLGPILKQNINQEYLSFLDERLNKLSYIETFRLSEELTNEIKAIKEFLTCL